MSRPNKCIKDPEGNDVWVVRSSVVIPIVFKIDKSSGDVYTLLEKRGPAVTHSGEWCCPCGYIDWDETLEEACQREVFEETSIKLDINKIFFFDVGTNKYSRNQAIDHWYMCWCEDDSDFDINNIESKDEILELKWLKVAHYEHPLPILHAKDRLTIFTKTIFNGYGQWAFKGHKLYIIKMLKKHFSDCNIFEVEA